MKKTKFIGFLAFLAAGLAAASCSLTGEEDEDPVSGELTISLSKDIIKANGEDFSVIQVRKGEELLTEGVTVYDAKTNLPLDLPEMKFTTTTPGEYSFWAAYGTEHTGTVTLNAIDFDVPELPEDNDPSALSFNKKLLITQFTGTGCGYCPFMINIIKKVISDPAYADRLELSVAHTFNSNDPAFLSAPLDQAMAVSGYPTVVFDMHTQFNNYNSETGFRKAFDDVYSRSEAKAGISVSSYMEGNTLVLNAAVKAAEAGEYRVGAWVLEDGIKANQANNGAKPEAGVDFNVHNKCIRVADSRVSSNNYTGHSVGELATGGVGKHVFIIKLEDKWVRENLSLVVFVSSKDKKGFSVTNAISCKIGDKVPYSYSK